MQYPPFDLLALPPVAIEEALQEPADLSADHFRNILCQQDVESGVAQVKSHGPQRIGECICFRGKNFRALRLFSTDHYSRGAVTKQYRRNQVGLLNVLALKRERGQLHGDNQDVSSR